LAHHDNGQHSKQDYQDGEQYASQPKLPHDPRNASKQILAQIALKLIGDRSAGDKKEKQKQLAVEVTGICSTGGETRNENRWLLLVMVMSLLVTIKSSVSGVQSRDRRVWGRRMADGKQMHPCSHP